MPLDGRTFSFTPEVRHSTREDREAEQVREPRADGDARSDPTGVRTVYSPQPKLRSTRQEMKVEGAKSPSKPASLTPLGTL